MTRLEKVTCIVFCTDPSVEKAQTYRRTDDNNNLGAVFLFMTIHAVDGQMGLGWICWMGGGWLQWSPAYIATPVRVSFCFLPHTSSSVLSSEC